MKIKILITGTAGFVGFHLAKKLINTNYSIIGIDNINNYYDVELKYSRLEELGIKKSSLKNNKIVKSNKFQNLHFLKLDIANLHKLNDLIASQNINLIIHLAAQAGVRYSIENPQAYIDSNIIGFLNILESSRINKVKKLIYASSSSVYGNNSKVPFSTKDRVDSPVSLYAVTKKSNELMAYTYNNLYGINSVGVRFFTVYGPWGRPDMAYFKFTKSAFDGNEIKVYNHGDLSRDFTYIDDVIDGLNKILERMIERNDICEIFNIGNNKPTQLKSFIEIIEAKTRKNIKKRNIQMQKGDVYSTHAEIDESISKLNYNPITSIEVGLQNFVDWYKKYYNIEN